MINPFNEKTTDILFYDKLLKEGIAHDRLYGVDLKFHIEMMTPTEYFKACANIAQCTMEEFANSFVSDSNLNQLISVIKKGDRLPIPFIDFVRNSQEGRHRMLACQKLGIESVPVMIIKEIDS